MSITTMALHVEPEAAAAMDAATALPLALAEAFSAHVTALVFRASLFGETPDAATTPDADDAAQEEAAADHLRKTLGARGLRFEVRGRASFAYGAGEVFADQMRVSDIGAMSFGSGSDIGKRFVATAGIFGSGRPLLLVPPAHRLASPPARIVVAWDASPAAVRAVHGALPLMRRAEGVTVVSVTDDKAFRHGQSGIELTHLLARHGAKAEFMEIQRAGDGVASAVTRLALERQAGLVVMGAVRHAPLHNLLFGTATMDLLDRGPALPTLLAA